MSSGFNWYLIDCESLSSEEVVGSRSLGASEDAFLTPESGSDAVLQPSRSGNSLFVNGTQIREATRLNRDEEYLIAAGGRFYLLKSCVDPEVWMTGLHVDRWIVQDMNENSVLASVPLDEIPKLVKGLGLDPDSTVTTIQGAEYGMFLRDFIAVANGANGSTSPPPPIPLPTLPETPETNVSDEGSAAASRNESSPRPRINLDSDSTEEEEEEIEINAISGEFTCPHCWQHFDRGDVMWVAKHPSLRDPELGDEFPLRFFPTSFDELGRAIDGMGVRCTDMACPNCRTRLPPQFLDLPCHIFSIVGAPSAGKSYFLTSMINQLEETLPTHFNLSFQDGDASGNALLSNMRARLFSDSSRPEEIALDKTVPGGEMFRTWERDGRRIKLPKPFTYLLAPFGHDDGTKESLHLVFYDNAGEQFEPAERSEAAESTDEDATRHLATSDAIFFLYDPATNVKFRKKIAGKNDPQVSDEKFLKLNRQDNIIAEMRIRIKSELYLDAGERLESPLAMIVGKCDLWADLLEGPLVVPITPDGLSLEAIARNSDLIRSFLLSTSPGVVGNAEAISREVVYFPASPIGHSPQPFKVPGGSDERIGPVPGKVNPIQVEVPVIWTLARLHPELVPVSVDQATPSAED